MKRDIKSLHSHTLGSAGIRARAHLPAAPDGKIFDTVSIDRVRRRFQRTEGGKDDRCSLMMGEVVLVIEIRQ